MYSSTTEVLAVHVLYMRITAKQCDNVQYVIYHYVRVHVQAQFVISALQRRLPGRPAGGSRIDRVGALPTQNSRGLPQYK